MIVKPHCNAILFLECATIFHIKKREKNNACFQENHRLHDDGGNDT